MARTHERPTLRPAFDVAKHAKDSDEQIARVSPEFEGEEPPRLPRSETRLSTRPSMGAVMTDETWARTMTGAPVVVVPPAELMKLPLDHRAGFLLSRMDGLIDVDTLVEVSAMPRADALRLVRDLYDSGIVEFQ